MINSRKYIGALLLFLISQCACRQRPVDAVYYGDWINTYTEEHHYSDGSSLIATEDEWSKDHSMMPPSLHLYEHSNYFQMTTTSTGSIIGKHVGRWSTRNNNDLTIQTSDYLFYAEIVLLNDVLSIEGIYYPLDTNRRTIRENAIQRKLKYRKATRNDLRHVKDEIKQLLEIIHPKED